MKVTEDMIAKIRTGDPISDAELHAMIQFLESLVESLDVMGPAYMLPVRDVRSQLRTLDGYNRARKER